MKTNAKRKRTVTPRTATRFVVVMFLTLKPQLIITLAFTFISYNACDDIAQRGFFDYLFGPCKCKCGVPNREARFIGGEYLRPYEFPWMVLIHAQEHDGKLISFPGALINNKYILTCGSRLIGITAPSVKVALGVFNKCEPDISSANISVAEIIVHPDYSAENRANDIALLKLSSPILFERRISPICLSVPGHNYLGQVATIAQWPLDAESSKTSCRPKKSGLPILNKKECFQAVSDENTLSADKGCMGLIGTFSVICKEDAGTPVMFRSYGGIYELIGITTDQGVCDGKEKGAGLYTMVNNHLPWITKNTKDACYCVKT